MTLTLIGVNHKTAPVELREKLSIPKGGESEVLDSLRDSSRLRGASLISTCNRVEVLTSSEDENVIEPVVEMLAERADIDQDEIEKHLYILRHRDVIRHMFRLASGLESMIVGEPQIGRTGDHHHGADGGRHRRVDRTFDDRTAVEQCRQFVVRLLEAGSSSGGEQHDDDPFRSVLRVSDVVGHAREYADDHPWGWSAGRGLAGADAGM